MNIKKISYLASASYYLILSLGISYGSDSSNPNNIPSLQELARKQVGKNLSEGAYERLGDVSVGLPPEQKKLAEDIKKEWQCPAASIVEEQLNDDRTRSMVLYGNKSFSVKTVWYKIMDEVPENQRQGLSGGDFLNTIIGNISNVTFDRVELKDAAYNATMCYYKAKVDIRTPHPNPGIRDVIIPLRVSK